MIICVHNGGASVVCLWWLSLCMLTISSCTVATTKTTVTALLFSTTTSSRFPWIMATMATATTSTTSSTSTDGRANSAAARPTTPTTPTTVSASASSRLVFGSDDALFGSIEARHQGDQQQQEEYYRPFGRVLDAGTGLHSLRWLATLRGKMGLTRCVAVTADPTMQRNCQREVQALGVADCFDVVCGNWFLQHGQQQHHHRQQQRASNDDDNKNSQPVEEESTDLPAIVHDELFDTILADYLIGAMDGFSPYTQDLMLGKLARHLRPGGRLYLVGLEPLPDSVPDNAAATLVCRIGKVRDACILLAGHRCYREYPLEWIVRQVRDGGPHGDTLRLVHSSQFPILYSYATALKQINVGRSKLPIIRRNNAALAAGLATELDALDAQLKTATDALQSTSNGKIELGMDYVVTIEKKL